MPSRDQNVLRLEVPVHNIFVVQVFYSLRYLNTIISQLVVCKATVRIAVLYQVSFRTIVEYEIVVVEVLELIL